MFISRLVRCARSPALTRAPRLLQISQHTLVRTSRPISNFPSGPRYVRFGSEDSSHKKPWDARKWDVQSLVAAGVGVLALGYYLLHLEQVPETGRWRFMDISPKYEAMLAETSQEQLMQEFKGRVLPPDHPLTRHIRRVTSRILEASNLGALEAPDVHRPKDAQDVWSFGQSDELPPEVGGVKKWHLLVVNDDSVINAMASYGSIVVFTGILPVAKDEHGLAAVLGHEIGHAVARHASERYSSLKVLIFLGLVLDAIGIPFSGWASQLLYDLPNSRKQEYEADKIGLRLSSRACFDPAAVPQMYERLGRAVGGGRSVDFLRTHPASEKRSKALRDMLPEAYTVQASSPMCGSTTDHMAAFRDTWLGGLDPDKMSEGRW